MFDLEPGHWYLESIVTGNTTTSLTSHTISIDVKPGETTEIDLLVTNATGKPLSNVNVEVDVADGVFTATGKTVIVGPTNGRGEFRTEWKAPDPALSGYKLSFRAKIDGVAEGREELLILVD